MSSILEPPPPTKWNVLSFGSGTQTIALSMMIEHEIFGRDPIDFGVFADTGDEPDAVYSWLERTRRNVSFPIYTVQKGVLSSDELTVHRRADGSPYLKNNIPAFGLKPNGEMTAALGRRCTSDYKIEPIQKFIKEKCGVASKCATPEVTMWIGISWDEIQRVRDPRKKWIQHRYPLIEQKITRHECAKYIKRHFGEAGPRSACVYCPFHSDEEWRNLRDNDPDAFDEAVRFDDEYRRANKLFNPNLQMEVYLHRSCKPLSEIDFDNDEDKGQQVWDFNAECEGMCGL